MKCKTAFLTLANSAQITTDPGHTLNVAVAVLNALRLTLSAF
jgi:hypothetical protein